MVAWGWSGTSDLDELEPAVRRLLSDPGRDPGELPKEKPAGTGQ
jgi:hypothetical protein